MMSDKQELNHLISLRIRIRSYFIDFQNHLHQLCGQDNLLPFRFWGFNNVLLPHIYIAHVYAVDTEGRIISCGLFGLQQKNFVQ